jgi:crossover junction endodeoxyribonuclease RuvC
MEGDEHPEIVEAGVFRLASKRPVADRLVELSEDFCDVLDRLRPQVVAVEKLYAHYKHPTTAAIMGHARGVVLLHVRQRGASLVELGATEVKKSLTGNGHASKGQMQAAVQVQLALAACPDPPDVADAIAIALCCMRRWERLELRETPARA